MVGFGKKSHSDTDKELRSDPDQIELLGLKKKEEKNFTIPLVVVIAHWWGASLTFKYHG